MRNVNAVSVVLVAAVAGATVMPVAGCAARRRARENQVVERNYAQTTFVNEGDVPLRVTVVVGERRATPPGMGTSFVGEPQTVAPGGAYKALLQEKKPFGAGFLFPENQDLVMRFKVESSSATWEPARVAWFEVVGPTPPTVRLLLSESGAPVAMAESGRVEAVPTDWWPKE